MMQMRTWNQALSLVLQQCFIKWFADRYFTRLHVVVKLSAHLPLSVSFLSDLLSLSHLHPSIHPLLRQITGGYLTSPVEPRAAGREEQHHAVDHHHLRRTHVQKPLHPHPAEQRQPQ